MSVNFSKVTGGSKACIATASVGVTGNFLTATRRRAIIGLLLGLGLSAQALAAAGGVIYFTGGVTVPTCATQAQASNNKVSLRMQCENSAPVTQTLDYKSASNLLNRYVAVASLQAVGKGQSVMTLEYR